MTRYKISEFIYGMTYSLIPPGPHSDGEPAMSGRIKSLFHDVESPNTQAAVNLRKENI